MAKRFDAEELAQLAAALNYPAPLDLRANPIKATRDDVHQGAGRRPASTRAQCRSRRSACGSSREAARSRACSRSRTAGSRCRTKAASCLCSLVAPKRGEMIVDFCAGAGGKTLALGAMMRSTGRLYAFDVSDRRLAKLKPRLARSGLSNVNPVLIDSEHDAKIKRLAGKIDRVLVDAPCSGLGTLRRNPDLKWRQSPDSVAELAPKQLSILASAARLVKVGGRLGLRDLQHAGRGKRGASSQQFLATHPDFKLGSGARGSR